MWAPDKLATHLERVDWARPDGSRPEWVCDRPLVAYRVWRSMSSAAVDLEGAWRGITDRYVEDANRLGVRTDPAAYYRYRAFRSLHSGRHHEAAEAYRRLAELNSSRKSSALAVAAHRAGSPLLSVLSWRDRRRVPQAIRNEATGWLDDVERNGHRWVGELPGLV